MEIYCHKILSGYFSTFLDVTCYGSFRESAENKIKLPEEDPQLIQIFISWMYSGHIVYHTNIDKDPEPLTLLRLWVLGDGLGALEFANAVMNRIFQHYSLMDLLIDEVEYVYQNTLPNSKLREFVREMLRIEGPFSKIRYDVPEWSDKWFTLYSQSGDLVQDFFQDTVCGEGDWSDAVEPPHISKDEMKYLMEPGLECARVFRRDDSHHPCERLTDSAASASKRQRVE